MNQETFAPREYTLADQATTDERASFIVKTYLHLFGAILALIALDAVLLSLPIAERMTQTLFGAGYMWLIALGVNLLSLGFVAVSSLAIIGFLMFVFGLFQLVTGWRGFGYEKD